MLDLTEAKRKQRETGIRWGFMWALWCAILWGAWYVPGTALWYESPYATMNLDDTGEFLLAAAVITTLNAVAVLFFMFIWVGVLEKWREYYLTLRQFRRLSKWYFLGAIFGGPIAIFGSFMAMGYIGAVFAAVAALLYPMVGSFIAYIWYKEKITGRAVVGILLIIAAGLVIYAPGIVEELRAGSGGLVWLGYLGGLMAAVGWGIEGAIAGRALDVSEPDVGLTVRFTAETLYWIFIILPVAAIFFKAPVATVVVQTLNPWAIVWLLLAGITFGFCYVSWYKSFPLIGVGRGQAIADLYGIFAIIFVALFTLEYPKWNFALGCVLAILGCFIMFTEKRDVLEVIRSIPSRRVVTVSDKGISGGSA